MKASYSIIKHNTKAAMKGHIGEVILVGLILPMAFSMIASFFNSFFGLVHWSLPNILVIFTDAIATYLILRMVIKISRFKSNKIFNDFIGTKKGILNSMGYALVSVLLISGYIVIFWDYIILAFDFMEVVTTDYYVSNPDALEDWVRDYPISTPSLTILYLTFIYSIFVIFVSVRLTYTMFIIADSDIRFYDAMKKSWNLTKGNWWRVFFFPLSFILWFLLVIITLGIAIVYVGPYMTISQGSFYNHLLKESGEEIEIGNKKIDLKVNITDESALDENKDTFDKEDPFENYYE